MREKRVSKERISPAEFEFFHGSEDRKERLRGIRISGAENRRSTIISAICRFRCRNRSVGIVEAESAREA